MPSFHCKAVHPEGRVLEEVRTGESIDSVVNGLQQEGYVPVRVKPAAGLFSVSLARGNRALRSKDILLFTQELQVLLEAGLPLDQALRLLLELTEDTPKLYGVIDQILGHIKRGASLSVALEQAGQGFTRFYVGMIRSGETGGDLAGALNQLSGHLERMDALRSTVTSAMIYPAILLVASVASVILLMTWVLPQFVDLFETAGKELPWLTSLVMTVAEGLGLYWWLYLALVVVGLLMLRHVLSTPELRYRWDRFWLQAPVIGSLSQKIEISHFAQALQTMLANGLTLFEGLELVKSTVGNRYVHESIEHAQMELKRGGRIAAVMGKRGCFPRRAVQMLKLGEETGNLQQSLEKMAIQYEREVRTSIQRLLALFEPILILSMGLIIALIIFSVLIAVVSINDFAF